MPQCPHLSGTKGVCFESLRCSAGSWRPWWAVEMEQPSDQHLICLLTGTRPQSAPQQGPPAQPCWPVCRGPKTHRASTWSARARAWSCASVSRTLLSLLARRGCFLSLRPRPSIAVPLSESFHCGPMFVFLLVCLQYTVVHSLRGTGTCARHILTLSVFILFPPSSSLPLSLIPFHVPVLESWSSHTLPRPLLRALCVPPLGWHRLWHRP